MRHNDPYGLPEIIVTIVSSIVMVGGVVLIDGLIWSWALGKGLGPGLVVGGIAGIVLGGLFGLITSGSGSRASRQSMAGGIGGCLGGPLVLVGVVGAIVGVLRLAD